MKDIGDQWLCDICRYVHTCPVYTLQKHI